jgi:hypothetical protein
MDFVGSGSNLYEYVRSNCVSYRDPLGLDSQDPGCPSRPNFGVQTPAGSPGNVNDNIRLIESAAHLDRWAALELWLNLVRPGGDWDFKTRLGEEYADFGNINFAATGMAVGFGPYALHIGAGLVQRWQDLRTPEDRPWAHDPFSPGMPPFVAPYWDMPWDYRFIDLGVHYYNTCIQAIRSGL